MNNEPYAIGFIGGIMAVVMVSIIKKFFRTKKRTLSEYDERQKLKRAEAGSIAFKILVLWNLFAALFCAVSEKQIMTQFVWHLSGIFVAVNFFGIISIWKDAYFTVANSKKRFIIALVIVFSFLCFTCFIMWKDGKFFDQNGLMDEGFINVFAAITVADLLINIAIKKIVDKKSEEEKEA